MPKGNLFVIRTRRAIYPVEGSLKEAQNRAKELKLGKWRITKPAQSKTLVRSD
jgi:hypothetical protein